MTCKKWIRLSGAGEFRGQGNWHEVRGAEMERDWDNCSRTHFLPVAREFPDRELVSDDQKKQPRFVVEGGWLIYQFHNVGVKLTDGSPRGMDYAKQQLLHLLKTVLIIDGGDDAAEA